MICEVELYWFAGGAASLPLRFTDRIWFEHLADWALGEEPVREAPRQ